MSLQIRLLLRQAKWRFVILLIGMAAFGVMMGFGRETTPAFIVLGAIGGSAFMLFPSLLRSQIAPVTDRQLAWIPLGAVVPLLLAGAAAQMFTQFVRGMSLRQMTNYWIPGAPLCCFALLTGLMFLRMVRLNPGFMGFLGFFGVVGQLNSVSPRVAEIISEILLRWPAALLGVAVLVLEAPFQAAAIRQMNVVPQTRETLVGPMPDYLSPARRHWATRLVDGVMYACFVGLIAAGFGALWFVGRKNLLDNPFLLMFGFFLLFPAWGVVWAWRQNRAAGMGVVRAVFTVLLRGTLVLEPWRDKLGVPSGSPVPCKNCGGWRFGWQDDCPHCSGTAVVDKPIIPIEGGGFWRGLRYDPLIMLYRVWGPMYLGMFIAARWLRHWL